MFESDQTRKPMSYEFKVRYLSLKSGKVTLDSKPPLPPERTQRIAPCEQGGAQEHRHGAAGEGREDRLCDEEGQHRLAHRQPRRAERGGQDPGDTLCQRQCSVSEWLHTPLHGGSGTN